MAKKSGAIGKPAVSCHSSSRLERRTRPLSVRAGLITLRPQREAAGSGQRCNLRCGQLGKRPGPGEAALPLVSEPIRVEQAEPATPPRGQAYFRSDWTSPLPITAGASEVSANSKKRLVPICGVGSTRWWPIEVGAWRSPPLGQTLEQAGVARAPVRQRANQSWAGQRPLRLQAELFAL